MWFECANSCTLLDLCGSWFSADRIRPAFPQAQKDNHALNSIPNPFSHPRQPAPLKSVKRSKCLQDCVYTRTVCKPRLSSLKTLRRRRRTSISCIGLFMNCGSNTRRQWKVGIFGVTEPIRFSGIPDPLVTGRSEVPVLPVPHHH